MGLAVLKTTLDHGRRARDVLLSLVGERSVNGTPDEARFGVFLARFLREIPSRRIVVSADLIPGDRLGRRLVLARLRGTAGDPTLLVVGHYDTVGTADYGPDENLALRPAELTQKWREHPSPEVAKDARDGRHLFGRGTLDMKAGLAAMVAALEELSAGDPLSGDVLFAFCPDEEADSAGARALRQMLSTLERTGSRFVGCINTDFASAPQEGRHVVCLGSVGKVLPALFVGGAPTHAALPGGLTEPAELLGAIVHRLAFHPDLADGAGSQKGPPPVVLHVADSRQGYDVQTLPWAYAYLNVLTLSCTPAAVMQTCRRLTQDALDGAWQETASRLAAQNIAVGPKPELRTWADVRAELEATFPGELDGILADAAAEGDARERARRVVELAWQRLGSRPSVILFQAQDMIPRVASDGGTLLAALAAAAAAAGVEILELPLFPAISDMSFIVASPDEAEADAFRADFPLSPVTPPLPPAPTMPIIDVGPEGTDAHRPTERVETAWSCGVLPGLISDTARRLLA